MKARKALISQSILIAVLALSVSLAITLYAFTFDELSKNIAGVVLGLMVLAVALGFIKHRIGEYTTPVYNRVRIIRDFADQMGFCYSKSKEFVIAEASFSVPEWAHEYNAMTLYYATKGNYLQGPHVWLRVYLLAFTDKNFSPDFAEQKRIVIRRFNNLYQEIVDKRYESSDEAIKDINYTFKMNFDEYTFALWRRMVDVEDKLQIDEGPLVGSDPGLKELIRVYASEG